MIFCTVSSESRRKCLLTDSARKLRRASRNFRKSALRVQLAAWTNRRQAPMPRISDAHTYGIAQDETCPLEYLRLLRRLAVVDIKLFICPIDREEVSIPETYKIHLAGAARGLEAWKKRLTQVLEDSPSGERKSLRWKVLKPDDADDDIWVNVEEGELEVGLDTLKHNKGTQT